MSFSYQHQSNEGVSSHRNPENLQNSDSEVAALSDLEDDNGDDDDDDDDDEDEMDDNEGKLWPPNCIIGVVLCIVTSTVHSSIYSNIPIVVTTLCFTTLFLIVSI